MSPKLASIWTVGNPNWAVSPDSPAIQKYGATENVQPGSDSAGGGGDVISGETSAAWRPVKIIAAMPTESPSLKKVVIACSLSVGGSQFGLRCHYARNRMQLPASLVC